MDLTYIKPKKPPPNSRLPQPYHDSDEMPWRPSEVDQFRAFLINSKTKSKRDKVAGLRNLCVIRGQTGSGKVTTIRRLCESLRIKLIEYDPFNNVPNGECEFDYSVDNLIVFLQNSLSRKALKSTNGLQIAKTNESISVGHRRVKRIKSSESSATDSEEGQLVMVCDLPRGILNCKYSSVYPLQNLIRQVLSSQTTHPLVIVTTKSIDDYLILKRILPPKCLIDPLCLHMNLKEITKTQIITLLKLNKKNKFLDHLIDISAGDIRYILNNISFYHNGNEDSEGLREYLLERNDSNIFELLHKIFFNKRMPITILEPDPNDHCNGVGDDQVYTRFEQCFELSRGIKGVNSTVRDDMPVKVKIYGLTEEFDGKNAVGYTKWPKVVAEDEGVCFRQKSANMRPKVTRPLLHYRPEKLVESLKSDFSNFSNCIFDNYSDLFGHIDDCASFTSHLSFADVYHSGHKNAFDPEVGRVFISICIRAAADCNIHGFESHKEKYHQFTTLYNRSRPDHILTLFQDFKSDPSSCENRLIYKRNIMFCEILPTFSMVGMNDGDASRGEYTQTVSTDDEYNITDVIDQVEKMLEKSIVKGKSKPVEFETIFTPKFNEMMYEVSKYYISQARKSQDSI